MVNIYDNINNSSFRYFTFVKLILNTFICLILNENALSNVM